MPDPPESVAELHAQLAAYRPELAGTPEARDAARFLLWEPPLPLSARLPYGVLAAASVGLMPRWTRLPLRLPWLPVAEATVVRAGGTRSPPGSGGSPRHPPSRHRRRRCTRSGQTPPPPSRVTM